MAISKMRRRHDALPPTPDDPRVRLPDHERKTTTAVLDNGTVLTTYMDPPLNAAAPPETQPVRPWGATLTGYEGGAEPQQEPDRSQSPSRSRDNANLGHDWRPSS